MWVKINKNYAGELGMFVSGQKHDLPKEIIAGLRDSLGKENVVDTCAPCEEKVDKKAVAHAEAISNANAAIANVERMKAEIVELRKVAARINTLKREIEDGTEKAKFLAKEAGIPWP